ncbi:o-succinylbenzoate synthase [Nesterenkonia populi]|uniref:o-succinylbenzoate synthase n=1 Tax=Nesterenkonia populi TaxID=1591087 RepID=UPI0011BE5380|nr:o-succinylbenzoate synthase [Nesterenkonia populi]
MKLESVTVRRLKMEMLEPFTTSFATQTHRDLLIVEAHSGGDIGYGECVAIALPLYSEEATSTAAVALEEFIIPTLRGQDISHPFQVSELLSPFKRNNMAKAALEGAVWNLWATKQSLSLAESFGGNKSAVDVGLSIGIKETEAELIEAVGAAADAGYKRVKIKIAPGRDDKFLRAVRAEFPDTPIMADANSAYSLDDVELFAALDELNLLMIEQPLAHDDIVDHRHLQSSIRTPICLDESIHSAEDARQAIELGSCRIINVKIGRVGGIAESQKIERICHDAGIGLWCGGMLETGIGRAHNVAIAALEGFNLPGDTAPSSRYWSEDIIEPEVVMDNGQIKVPTVAGLGYRVRRELLEQLTTSSFSIDLGVS